MRIARLIIGIISIIFSGLITFQSCAVGLSNTLGETGEISGSAGFFLSICMLIAGIVGIATRKSKGGIITAGVFFAIGGLMGIANVGSYSDLMFWSILSFIFAAIYIFTAITEKKTEEVLEKKEKEHLS